MTKKSKRRKRDRRRSGKQERGRGERYVYAHRIVPSFEPAEKKVERDIRDPNRLCLYDTVLRHKRHVSLAKEKPWWRPSCTHRAFINDVTSPTSGAGETGGTRGCLGNKSYGIVPARVPCRRKAARVYFSSPPPENNYVAKRDDDKAVLRRGRRVQDRFQKSKSPRHRVYLSGVHAGNRATLRRDDAR